MEFNNQANIVFMPGGASAKREEEYRELKAEFKKEGRYKGREEEVASRIVNKQRRELSETERQKQQEKEGKAPDRDLPLEGYRHLAVATIMKRLHNLSYNEIKELRKYEKRHKARKTMLAVFDRALKED